MYPPRRIFSRFIVQFAETASHWQAVKRLRYDVFTKEMGRLRYANHVEQTYADELDIGRSHAVLAFCDGDPVGTLRFTIRAETSFLDEDEPRFADLLGRVDPRIVALADRGAIRPEARMAGLYPVMWDLGCEYLRSLGVRLLVGVIRADDDRLVRFHQRQGWRNLSERVVENGTPWNFIAKDL